MGAQFEKLVQIFKLKRDNGYPKGHLFAPLVLTNMLCTHISETDGQYLDSTKIYACTYVNTLHGTPIPLRVYARRIHASFAWLLL